MKKKIVAAAAALLLILTYFTCAFAPYSAQYPAENEAFEASDFFGDSESTERVKVVFTAEDALDERLRLIESAESSIILTTFEYKPDTSGKLIMAALYAAAERGVEVKILIDGFAYFTDLGGSDCFKMLSKNDNISIRVYNPVRLTRPGKMMARMHDKYIIVDDESYILGGRNTHDQFLGSYREGQKCDWDIVVTNSDVTESSSVRQLEAYFESVWELDDTRSGERMLVGPTERRAERAVNELHRLYAEDKEQDPERYDTSLIGEGTLPTRKITLLFNPINTGVKRPTLFYEMTQLMLQMDGDIYFHTPYILCSDDMLARLSNLCSEDRSVTVMTNSPANNANLPGTADYLASRTDVLKTGVRLLEYDGGSSYHGKCFTVGGRISGVGSFNWDMRSAYIDTEIMAVIDSSEVNACLRGYMQTYERESIEVDESGNYVRVGDLPLPEMSTGKRIVTAILGPIVRPLRFLL